MEKISSINLIYGRFRNLFSKIEIILMRNEHNQNHLTNRHIVIFMNIISIYWRYTCVIKLLIFNVVQINLYEKFQQFIKSTIWWYCCVSFLHYHPHYCRMSPGLYYHQDHLQPLQSHPNTEWVVDKTTV